MVTSIDIGLGFPVRTIRILFYTDQRDSNFQSVPQPGQGELLRHRPTEFGLRIAKDLMEAQSSLFLRFRVDVINRHYDFDANGAVQDFTGPMRVGKHKLTPALLQRYQQVWFFGQLYANYTSAQPDYGNAEAELNDAEVAALRAWMDAGGGVLMTGDHSNHVEAMESSLMDASLRGKQLNLGRAIGHRVPRAGAMRVWVGDPGSSPPDHVVDTANDPDMGSMPKQEDATPQTIRVLQVSHRVQVGTIGATHYAPLYLQDDHPLFKAQPTADYPSSVIDVLPDHVHEGAVAIPTSFDPALWPRRGNVQPRPHVVAWGTNWAARYFSGIRSGAGVSGGLAESLRLFPEVALVAAYDGDRVGVGRIVAHSTWHHFVNVNLVGFRKADGSPGKVLDRIGSYYRNLALWLSPQKERASVLFDAMRWAVHHPLVREVHGGPPPWVGRTAASLLQAALGPGAYADLMQLTFASVPRPDERVREDAKGETGADEPQSMASVGHELVLGLALQQLARESLGDRERGGPPVDATLRAAGLQAIEFAQRQHAEAGRALGHLADAIRDANDLQ